jgi:hypothetical protein
MAISITKPYGIRAAPQRITGFRSGSVPSEALPGVGQAERKRFFLKQEAKTLAH